MGESCISLGRGRRRDSSGGPKMWGWEIEDQLVEMEYRVWMETAKIRGRW